MQMDVLSLGLVCVLFILLHLVFVTTQICNHLFSYNFSIMVDN